MFNGYPMALHVILQLVTKLDALMADTTVVLLRALLRMLGAVFSECHLVLLQQMCCELNWTTSYFILAQCTFFSGSIAPFLNHGGKVFRFHLEALIKLQSWNHSLANTNPKIICFICLHAQTVRLEMVVDAGVGPGNKPGASRNLALVLPDLLHTSILLSVFAKVHPMLRVDVGDVADLGSELSLAGDAGEVGASVPGCALLLVHRHHLPNFLLQRRMGQAREPLEKWHACWNISPGVSGSVGPSALANGHHWDRALVHILLQGH